MTTEQAIKLMLVEATCIERASNIEHPCTRECEKCELIQKSADLLAAYGMAVAALRAQQWISVKDRLPENEEDDVLIYCRETEHYGLHKEKRKAYHAIYKGAYDGDRWYTNWCHGCKYIEDVNAEWLDEEITVTHWMPLPEPPKEEHGE